jgi:ubiquinone biosynthesis protein
MLPQEMSEILQSAGAGQLNVQLEHRRLDSIVNRLVYGILTAALFLGSCWLMSGQIPPLVKGISVPGLVAFLASMVLGMSLLRNIAKSGGLGKR